MSYPCFLLTASALVLSACSNHSATDTKQTVSADTVVQVNTDTTTITLKHTDTIPVVKFPSPKLEKRHEATSKTAVEVGKTEHIQESEYTECYR